MPEGRSWTGRDRCRGPTYWLTLWMLVTPVSGAQSDRYDVVGIAETILLYQRDNGGWPKNYDRSGELDAKTREKLLADKSKSDTTFDNGATHTELRLLAKAYSKSSDPRFKDAFLSGLKFTLAAQYDNGGWPQRFPEPRKYHAHITFNDDAMIGVLQLLREVATGAGDFAFVDGEARKQCRDAVKKGVACILRCQIVVDGVKTAWCAQHDEVTFVPRRARSYELPSISGSESVGVVQFLIGIEEPGDAVIESVDRAVAWFESAKLTGIRVERRDAPSMPRGFNKVVVKDANAPPLWARFHQIGTNRPIFCSRDGIPRAALADISYERRNGYKWLTDRPARLLSVEYPAWKLRISKKAGRR